MKHILSFLFFALLFLPYLSADDESQAINISFADGTTLRTGFTSTVKNVSASVYTLHTKETSIIQNWYIKNTDENISWTFGTISFQGIVSFTKNPDFTLQSSALQKNTLSKGTIVSVLPSMSSSPMKEAGFLNWTFPLGTTVTPSVSFLYAAKDSLGNNEDNTLALSLTLPFIFTKAAASTSFTAFNYKREFNTSSTWYPNGPYIEPGRYFIFTNASSIKFPLFEIAFFSGMSEKTKSQWDANCLTEIIWKIPLQKIAVTVQGKLFLNSYDYITLSNSHEKTVFHASINPQIVIPLNEKKSLHLSAGILEDYKKSFTAEIPTQEQTNNTIKASLGLTHSYASAEFHCSADNTVSSSFLSLNTTVLCKLNFTVNLIKFTIVPIRISAFLQCSAMPLSNKLYETASVYANIVFMPKMGNFSINTASQINFSNTTGSFESLSISAYTSLYNFQLGGSYKHLNNTSKDSYTVSLSYRLKK